MNEKTTKIYVDIQSLLDLRQGALIELLGEDKAVEYVTSEDYNFREVDEFPVDMQEFKKRLSRKDATIFRTSTLTYIITTLRNKLENIHKRNAAMQVDGSPEILLNTYPHQLTHDQVRIVQNAFFVKLETGCLINVIYEPIKAISPQFIRNMQLTACYIYDFTQWCEEHLTNVNPDDFKETILYFPAVGSKKLSPQDLKAITDLGFKDVFSYTEFVMSRAVNVTFLPPYFYSNIIAATRIVEELSKTLSKTKVSEMIPENLKEQVEKQAKAMVEQFETSVDKEETKETS